MRVDRDQTVGSARSFEQLISSQPLLHALTQNNFVTPTPIQEQAIPQALAGADILGSAQTGTGKTLAFAIPLIAHVHTNASDSALIIVPTRELAVQVQQAVQKLLVGTLRVPTALLIGGEPIFKQFRQLKACPRIIIATPGRLLDHLDQGTFRPDQITFLVLDEMDRMFDMGFDVQIAEIINKLPQQRQTLMFSATLPSHIEKRAQSYLKSPVRISAGPTSVPAANITQEVVHVPEAEKYAALVTQLNQRTGSVIVFVKTKIGAARLADKLSRENHPALAMHGNLRQQKREQVVKAFRKGGRERIMVATDIAARGLDIPHIQHVINYDLPQCPEDYIHRIGRTARAGATGFAVCLISPHERRQWLAIDRLLNPSAHTGADTYERDSFPRRNGGGNRGGRGRSSSGFRSSERSSSSGFRSDRRSSDRPFERSPRDHRSSERTDRVDRPQFDRPPRDHRSSERTDRVERPQFDRSPRERSPERTDRVDRPQFDRSPRERSSERTDRPYESRSERPASSSEGRNSFGGGERRRSGGFAKRKPNGPARSRW